MFHRWRLVAGLITTLGLVLTMAGGGAMIASAGNGNGNGNDTKTTICHRTASHTNPYVKITVDNNATNGNGGLGDHYNIHTGPIAPATGPDGKWGDIIPPVEGNAGQNWTAEGQAIYNNNCRISNELWDSGVTTTIFRSNGAALGTPQAGVSVYDTAVVTYDETTEIAPTGTVTYSFYNTADATGPATTQVVNLNSGAVPNSSTHGPLGAGTYSFRAVYSGDANYKQSTSAVEPLIVLKADPGISTNQDPDSGLVGTTIKDSASVTGGFNPTGTVTFVLKLNGSTVLTSDPVALDAQGDAAFTTGYLANTAGTYYWVATYSGDTNNNGKTSGETDEPVVITEAPPGPKKSVVVTTTVIDSSSGKALTGSETAGASVYDTARVVPPSALPVPTGTVTYSFYNTIDATGPATTQVVNLNSGAVPDSSTHGPLGAGTYSFRAVYSGDANYKQSTSPIEPLTIAKSDPSISTITNPDSAVVGDILKDSATLGGGYNPTGTITFSLYDPSNTVAHTESVTVTGAGVYATPVGAAATGAGTWHWKAEYSGDANNNAVASVTSSEPVVVTEGEIVRVQPSLTTTPNPTNATVGATLKDSATLTGGDDPQGTITFTLLDPSGSPVHTESVTVDGNNTYSTPTGHVAGSAGTWHWMAEYSGDTHNKAAASEPGSEPVTVTQGENVRVQPTISTTPTPTSTTVGATLKDTATLSGGDNPTGSILFTLYDPSGTAVHTEEVAVAGNGSYSTPAGHIAPIQGTWHWKAEYSGDANNLPAASNAADEPVTVAPTGGVLAQTAAQLPGEGLAAGLLTVGLLAIFGAIAWRRRLV